jgi:hypothetical protein
MVKMQGRVNVGSAFFFEGQHIVHQPLSAKLKLSGISFNNEWSERLLIVLHIFN